MKTRIVTYKGEAPEIAAEPALMALLELFKQQNEILRQATMRTYIVPAGTQLRTTEIGSEEQDNVE